jgi:hypothetical protein
VMTMIKVLSKIAVLSGLVLATYLLIILVVHVTGGSRPLAAIIDKENLLHSTPSPKVVFVGGSNVAEGIDSPLVEEKLGMPVVNMGLHGGLGLRFDLNQVKPYVRAGDLIIVSPEYQSFVDLVDGDETILDVLYLYPEAARYLEPVQFIKLLGRVPASLQVQFEGLLTDWIMPQADPIYSRESFNRNGDEVGHLNRPSTIDLTGKNLFGSTPLAVDDESMRLLNEFDAYAREKGAHVLLTFPPIPSTQYTENKEIILQVCQKLRDESTVQVLGSPVDDAFPIDYFFDTLYHLNSRGREERTAKIIDFLQSAQRSVTVESNCGKEREP